MIANMGARLLLALVWLLHWLPLPLLALLGRGFGRVLHVVAGGRRRVALRNIELCFPELTPAQRAALVREHFEWVGRSFLERGVLWHASRERLKRLIRVEGDPGFAQRNPGTPVMWLSPHFLAIEQAGMATQLYQTRAAFDVYAEQSNAVLDAALLRGRGRFGTAEFLSRNDGARAIVRLIRRGQVFFNPPDMDFGLRDAAFVPFFSNPAATLLAPSRIARSLKMTVQPVVAEFLPGGQGYNVRFLPPWTDWPSDDPLADALRMNQFIEEQVRLHPTQYFWVHKRFKTRPPGEAPSIDPEPPAGLLRQGLALALQDVGHGRAQLLQATREGPPGERFLAGCALLLFTGIADDDYSGFEDAAAAVSGQTFGFDDPADALLAEAGALTAGAFNALDAPSLAPRAALIARALDDQRIPAPLRCCAGLAALGYHHIGMDLAGVLWLELAMRPLLTDPQVGPRLAGEALHLLVQSLYQCEGSAQAVVLRERWAQSGVLAVPVIRLKMLLLEAQMALGAGQAETGRQALDEAEPLLDPGAPRPAGWWHLLRSRLELMQGRQRQALVHARLALRLIVQSQLPERWAGVTVMQEGQVQIAAGRPGDAIPFFERAGRAASGSQARICWSLVHLARALEAFARGDTDAGRRELASGLGIAREVAWLGFFRAIPAAAATLCTLALEHGIEAAFARDVIAQRGLASTRPDLATWPWPVRVHTFGGLRIDVSGQPLVFKGKVAKKPLELLLFVIASGGCEVPLAHISFALWRDLEGDKARAALNVALFRLRKLLGDEDALQLEHGRLSLDARRVWVDCLAFEQLVDSVGDQVLSGAARQAAERALALHVGAFLLDAQEEPWQALYGGRLASKFKRMVTLLARAAVARGDGVAARALLERGLEFDPLAEELARDLMRELIHAGEQAAALQVFERLRGAIEQVLGAKPSPATLELVGPLRRSAPPA